LLEAALKMSVREPFTKLLNNSFKIFRNQLKLRLLQKWQSWYFVAEAAGFFKYESICT